LVAPGVHRIPLPMPNDGLRAVNVYAIDGGAEGGCVLIDGGWAVVEAQNALEAALGELGWDFADIRRILVTHAHRDHYTLGIALQRALGTRVAIGIGERENVEVAMLEATSSATRVLPALGAGHLIDEWDSLYTLEDRIRSTSSFGLPDEWIADDQVLDAGTRTLTAIRTPGHTQGHLCFLDPAAAVLFTGDHVLPSITPSIGFEAARPENPLGDFLRSLRLLLTHPDAMMLPAHGAPTDSVHKRVHELLAHHEDRLTDTLAAARAGAGTAFEAARRLGWTRRQTPFEDLTLFNQILAIGETNTHLIVLCERGLLTHAMDGAGVIHYEPVAP
jgi:glyoxylase-like metal-dependent hydrolase (beta-lactamase superfamily II)